ncbi:ribose 5-phosphate isomerase B [Vagococcus sp. BWB3-3]|uniref:Ribose 5-phosphate isomerase B n=1 Tax=Vagococcus allomyrinae TaxID=2794353 RepID=A0A940SVI1_9ENTE|nr:ribose 5-phosphate isomerase B [Vagococcus allomyrinae]MBP1040348.1 ribose 5-phosphate isomerase B [Vagococcus allomyrinae]
MKIAIGNDHVGLTLIPTITDYLKTKGHTVTHIGAYSAERANYPTYGKEVALKVASQEVDCGILICGTGVGISLAANKVPGIRAVVCSEPYTAKLSKEHNNTNILAFGSRVIGPDMAIMIVENWLAATFEGGRHGDRLQMISQIEKDYR